MSSNAAMVSPAIAGPMILRDVEDGAVEGDGVADVRAANHLDHERLPDRHVERVDDAQAECEHEHVPDLDLAADDEDSQDQRKETGGYLGVDESLSLRNGVGQDAAEESEEEHRRELGGGNEAQCDRIVGQLEYQPRLADLLHPSAHQRHEHSEPEKPEVAMAECAETLRESRWRPW